MELVRLAVKGDGGAFHSLVDRHAKILFRTALSLSPTRSDAEDLMQETFAGAFKSLPRFDGRSSVRTWLTRILMRRAADAWRSGRRMRGSLPLDEEGPGTDVAGRSAGTSTVAVEHREVLVLRELNGLSYAQIAQTLGVPQGTVESRLYRAREELRRRLGDYFG
jgi:RNA polymerase sigma-70 factor (ECF subfamily)